MYKTESEVLRQAGIKLELERIEHQKNMRLRDEFAMAALSFSANWWAEEDTLDHKLLAETAYNIADAMMKARVAYSTTPSKPKV